MGIKTLFFISLFLHLCYGSNDKTNASRIWFGEEITTREKAPFVVLICDADISWYCTGVLIHEIWALGSAHCVFNKPKVFGVIIDVINLENDAKKAKFWPAESLYVHEDYIKFASDQVKKSYHDLVLLKFKTPLPLSDKLQTIPLEDTKWPWYKKMDRECEVYGYGRNSYNKFHTLRVGKFKAAHGERSCLCLPHYWLVCLPANQPDHTCYGDSGSPLVCDGKLVGIHSFLFNEDACNVDPKIEVKACYANNTVAVFTYTYNNLGWIQNKVPSHKFRFQFSRSSIRNSSFLENSNSTLLV